MIPFSHPDFLGLQRKVYTILLALCFLTGLGFGVVAYLSAEEALQSMMRSSLYCPVSITSLLIVTCLPFILSVLAVFLSQPTLILAIGFGKAFLFSFVAMGLCDCLQSTGGFLLFLFLCTDVFSIPLIYFFWLRSFSGKEEVSLSEAVVFFSVFVLLVSLYIHYISPIWAQIINFWKG